MYIIQLEAFESGARPPLQTWNGKTAPKGYALCPDEFYDAFYSTSPAGFVNIVIESGTVTKMTVNQEALDAYIASLPEEPEPSTEPTTDERVAELEAQLALLDDTAIELYEAQMEQEEINTAQDDALIEIYELIGG